MDWLIGMQSVLEVKLMRGLFAAARARLHSPDGSNGVQHAACAAHAECAAETPWDVLTTIAEALGYTVSENGSLQSDVKV
jgi:hypothetical protein